MKILEVLKEEVEPKSFDELLKELSEVLKKPLTVPFKYDVNQDEKTISISYHLKFDWDTLTNSTKTPQGDYVLNLVEILRPHLQILTDIFRGQETTCTLNVGSLIFENPNSPLKLNLYKFTPTHTVNSLQMYDASPEEILMGGLDFYTPVISNFPVYDTETTKRIQKVERRVHTVTKVLSKGTHEGTPYTTELINLTINVDTSGVKTDGVIHIQDLVPIIWIKVTPPEMGDVIRRKFGELMDIPEENIDTDIVTV